MLLHYFSDIIAISEYMIRICKIARCNEPKTTRYRSSPLRVFRMKKKRARQVATLHDTTPRHATPHHAGNVIIPPITPLILRKIKVGDTTCDTRMCVMPRNSPSQYREMSSKLSGQTGL